MLPARTVALALGAAVLALAAAPAAAQTPPRRPSAHPGTQPEHRRPGHLRLSVAGVARRRRRHQPAAAGADVGRRAVPGDRPADQLRHRAAHGRAGAPGRRLAHHDPHRAGAGRRGARRRRPAAGAAGRPRRRARPGRVDRVRRARAGGRPRPRPAQRRVPAGRPGPRAHRATRGRGPVGLASTFVPWLPDGPIAPTRVAWVLPLVDEPHRAPAEAMLDDELDALLEDEPGRRGRLQRALLSGRVGSQGACDERAAPPEGTTAARPDGPCRGEPVPVTYALDPDLLYSVEAMVRPYTVARARRAGRPAALGQRRAVARRRARGRARVGPAGAAVRRPGRDRAQPHREPGQGRRRGAAAARGVEARRLLRRAADEPPVDLLTVVAYPPPGPVEPVVDPLAAGGDTALLLDALGAACRRGRPRPHPERPHRAAVQLGDPVTALVADPALSALVEPDVDSGRLAGRPAGRAALARRDRGARGRAARAAPAPLVVAPRRQADLRVPVAIGALVDTGRVPWLCGVPLDGRRQRHRAAARRGRPASSTCRAPRPPTRAAPRGPSGPRTSSWRSRSSASSPPCAPTPTSSPSRCCSPPATAPRPPRPGCCAPAAGRPAAPGAPSPVGGRRMLQLLQEDVADLRAKIVAARSAPVLLTGRTGTVSLTVENGLDQPVNVGVELDPTSAARLTSEDTELQVVPGREARQVAVQVEARTSGRFTVGARLVDRAGRPFGDARRAPGALDAVRPGGARRHGRRRGRPARRRRRAHHAPRGPCGTRRHERHARERAGAQRPLDGGRHDRLARDRLPAHRRHRVGARRRRGRRRVQPRQHRAQHRLRAAARRGAHQRRRAAAGARGEGGRRRRAGLRRSGC